MITVQLMGGLGNQLFQYAVGRRLAHERGTTLRLDLHTYHTDPQRTYRLHHFNIQATVAAKGETWRFVSRRPDLRLMRAIYRFLLPARFSPFLVESGPYDFDRRVLQARPNVYLRGYWQHMAYFEPIAPQLRAELTVRTPADARNAALAAEIMATPAVGLHVRRGDFVTNPSVSQRYGLLDPSYYQQAAEMIKARVEGAHFFVFSDDPEWTKRHLTIDAPLTYVDHNPLDKDYEDFRLLTLCRHFIIANSTFSWWAAWLGSAPHKQVIAPRFWLRQPGVDTSGLKPNDWTYL